MNKILSRVLPSNCKAYIAYFGTKLSNRFQLKDQSKGAYIKYVGGGWGGGGGAGKGGF